MRSRSASPPRLSACADGVPALAPAPAPARVCSAFAAAWLLVAGAVPAPRVAGLAGDPAADDDREDRRTGEFDADDDKEDRLTWAAIAATSSSSVASAPRTCSSVWKGMSSGLGGKVHGQHPAPRLRHTV